MAEFTSDCVRFITTRRSAVDAVVWKGCYLLVIQDGHYLRRIQKHPTKRFHLLSFRSKVQLCLIKPMDVPRDVVPQNVDVRIQAPPDQA